MPRSLADGHEKIAVLFDEPVNPDAPTVAELNDGIDAACGILASDWTFSATDSDTFNDRAVCEANNANAFGVSNYQAGATVFREYDEDGAVDLVQDALYQGLKTKGTRAWIYSRLTGKDSTDPWAADDEIRLGAEVLTDTPQNPSDAGGYIKRRVPMQVQKGFPDIEAVA